MWCITTKSEEETRALGQKLGAQLRGSEIIELTSDLGGGKTTLTKGIAQGIASTDLVTSPTFTISNLYKGQKLTIHHYDFYRLGELGLMSEELHETLDDEAAVSVIEWAGEAHDLLPKDRLIRIEIGLVEGEESHRTIRISAGESVKETVSATGVSAC